MRTLCPASGWELVVFCFDESGRLLIVNPTYKPGWSIPGGAIDADESPYLACKRELVRSWGSSSIRGGLSVSTTSGQERPSPNGSWRPSSSKMHPATAQAMRRSRPGRQLAGS